MSDELYYYAGYLLSKADTKRQQARCQTLQQREGGIPGGLRDVTVMLVTVGLTRGDPERYRIRVSEKRKAYWVLVI